MTPADWRDRGYFVHITPLIGGTGDIRTYAADPGPKASGILVGPVENIAGPVEEFSIDLKVPLGDTTPGQWKKSECGSLWL